MHFLNKSCKILENFGRFLKIKNHRCLVPSRIWASVGHLGGLDNVEYGNNLYNKQIYFQYRQALGIFDGDTSTKYCKKNKEKFIIERNEWRLYKRVSILKIETTDEFAKYNKLIIKMDGLSALVWSNKTFSELELNWDGSSSFRNKILHSFQISTSNPSCFFNTCRASSISIYIFNIFY